MSELLEAAKAVLAWQARNPNLSMPPCPRMADGRSLACRCSELCSHERLRLAVEAEARKAHNARVQAGTTAPQPDPERDEAARRGASPGTKC